MPTRRTKARIDDAARKTQDPGLRQAATSLRGELNALAVRVGRALELGDEYLETHAAQDSVDCQRDILHLRVRIEGISRQIADAIATLDRIEGRGPDSRVTSTGSKDASTFAVGE